ncbi:protein PSK SIMULATOR 2 [Cannabis sativa]|uniref:protein PSK SIMULATOR 2 n=1 Tax=Cannabis sativa TaxID=3483 RepID=UPI0011E015AE|nr:protein PSK SIMULATOR 2 [Cannabis sativa]
MTWLSGTGNSICHLFSHDKRYTSSTILAPPSNLGILSFETARIISRLVSLYRSLSEDELRRLRMEIMMSKGVCYLNSRDERYLLSLAGAERLEELDTAAEAVSRLGRKCTDLELVRFDFLYADLRLGDIDMKKLDFCSKTVHKMVEKLEKLVGFTANLYAAMESLTELENSERKMNRWKKNHNNTDHRSHGHIKQLANKTSNFDHFHQKITYLRKQVQHYRDISLWNQSFDKTIGFMARIVCVVFARIETVFGPYISGLHLHLHHNPNKVSNFPDYCLLEDSKLLHSHNRKWASLNCHINHNHHYHHHHHNHRHHQNHRTFHPSGVLVPIELEDDHKKHDHHGNHLDIAHNRVSGLAQPSTVGASALAVRYANVIITAERCLHAPDTVNTDTREGLYEMLPVRLRTTVRSKLRSHWMKKKEEEVGEGCDGHALAMGWKEAVEEIMSWLAPMAHDTMKWQTERNYERQKYLEGTKPTVLLLQTLHFSDLEKTEAAIVEVLVGLSFVQRFENNRRRSGTDLLHHNHNHNRIYHQLFQPFRR